MRLDNQRAAKRGQIPSFDLYWFLAVLRNWLCVVLSIAGAWWAQNLLVYLLAIFVIGTRQHALVVLQHDGTHYHISRNKKLNDALMDIFAAWPLGFSTSGYRRYHMAHHRCLGTDGDPELATYGRFPGKWSADSNVSWLFATDLVGFGSVELLVLWLDIMRSRDPNAYWKSHVEIFGMLLWAASIGGLLLAFGGWTVLGSAAALWYLSLFTSFAAAFRLRAYAEHVGSDWTHRLREPALWRRLLYLPENTWLHWEHHKWPGIPLRVLKQLMNVEERTSTLQALSVHTPVPD